MVELNWMNPELEREALVARAAQGGTPQTQPDPSVRRPQGRPRVSRTRRHKNNQGNTPNTREEQPGNEIPQHDKRNAGNQPGTGRPPRHPQSPTLNDRENAHTYLSKGPCVKSLPKEEADARRVT
uniref:Uncharacterized protein n=1 Tax=Cannabis sativa TaxID=3483 RepID=A0A803NH58_CANSA